MGFDKQPPQDNEFLRKIMEQFKQDDSVLRIKMNDERLMRLAEYDATKGFMTMKVEPEQLQDRFLEFKKLVRAGDFTLKALEDDVYTRWGISEEAREESIRKATEDGTEPVTVAGFSINDMAVADIPKDSPENH